MFRKMMCLAILCPIFLMGATVAQAVTIDLSSPHTTVYPGDEVEMTATVTNNWDEKDIVHVEMTITVGEFYTAKGKLRLKMEPGEVVSQTIGVTVPVELQEALEMIGSVPVTVEAIAKGRRSHTKDSDSITATLAPLP